jgi:hypothetical protein
MERENSIRLEGYILALSEEKYSYSMIIKRCKAIGFSVSKYKIHNILKYKGFKSPQHCLGLEKKSKNRLRKSRSTETIQKVKKQITKEHPPTQRHLAISLGTSVSSINRIINKDLDLKMSKKRSVHRLRLKHINERKQNCRLLYENHLASDKWKYVVTLDEAWLYLSDCNKHRAIFYRKRGEKKFQTWFKESRESFPKGFMIVAGFGYNGKLTIRRIEKNAKINSSYYQEHILKPIFYEEIPNLYPGLCDKVEVHQNKASSHTSASTLQFLQNITSETKIKAIPFDHIPVKSPDASPMDFCAFGQLKRALERDDQLL